jgi:predicted ATP-dependent serine protease
MEFELDEIQIDEDATKRARMRQLASEIATLRAQLNVPAAIRNTIGGAAIGAGMGLGAIGTLALGIIGYNMGSGKSLTDEQKAKIQARLQAKAQELLRLQRDEEIEDSTSTGIMSSRDLKDYRYDNYDFDGKWLDLVGKPAKKFHMMVYGRPKQGKSYFCFDLAQYLSNFGKVLYIAAEEGFSATLQKKLEDMGGDNDNLDFANFRDYDTIKNALPGHDYRFVVIDSVNYIRIEPEQIEELKADNPRMALITVQQATKDGKFRGSQQFAHNCDIIIEVIQGVAHSTGRFAPPSEMAIFVAPEVKKGAPVAKVSKPVQQIDLFSEMGDQEEF